MRKLWIFLICLFIFFSTGCNDHKEKKEEQFDNVHTIIEEHQQNIFISINYPFTNIRKLDSVLEDNVQKIYQEFKEDYGSLNSLSKESELNIDYTYEVINDRFYNITITTFIDSSKLAHPITQFFTLVFDQKEDQFLELSDLISEKTLKKITPTIQQKFIIKYKVFIF